MAKSSLSVPHLQNEEAAFAYVEAELWPNGPVCPHCGTIGEASRSQGKTTRLGLWNCRACRKPFTVRMGTVFESSHLPLHLWLQVIHLMCSSKKGISTRQIQRTLKCSMKTAWHLTHRIREAMRDTGGKGPLGGIGKVVEADEAYVGGRDANKHRVRRYAEGKQPVVSLVERDGSVRSFHVPTVTGANLYNAIMPNVDRKSWLMTDEFVGYNRLGTQFAAHSRLSHKREEYVRGDGFVHSNSVENYFSILKRGINGCYFHVSPAHRRWSHNAGKPGRSAKARLRRNRTPLPHFEDAEPKERTWPWDDSLALDLHEGAIYVKCNGAPRLALLHFP